MQPTLLAFSLLSALPLLAQSATQVLVAETFGNLRAAYDEARQRLVVSRPGFAAYEHDGVAWAAVPLVMPQGHMLYDASTERVVFAGSLGNVIAYDGSSLEPRGPSIVLHRVAADVMRGRLVGVSLVSGGPLGSVIREFDGSAWTQVAAIPGVVCTGVAYDHMRAITVLSFLRLSPAPSYEVHEWDGASLTGPLVTNANGSAIAFDPVNQQVLFATSAGPALWNGTALTVLGAAQPSTLAGVTTDRVHGRVLALSDNAIWRWNGSNWAELMASPMPRAFTGRLTYDTTRDRAVLLGNQTAGAGTPVLLHAEFDGRQWQEVAPTAGFPPSLQAHAQVFDAARGETVVFGGTDPSTQQVFGSTHAYDGSSWRVAATTGPSPRTDAMTCYDSLRQRIVLVGGSGGFAGPQLEDHWEFDGAVWTQVAATTPIGGVRGAMGFDPIRNRVVVHTEMRSTFEYDGITWQQVAIAGPRAGYPALSFDPVRQELVATLTDANFDPTVFAWNGATWSPRTGPLGDYAFGDNGVGIVWTPQQTFVVAADIAGSDAYSAGCGGTNTTTSLVGFGRPSLGSATFHVDLRADARVRPAVLGYGESATSVPLGNGCALLISDFVLTQVWFTDTAGFVEFPLLIPATPSLAGAELHAQGVVLDPASADGLALSNGLRLTIGH